MNDEIDFTEKESAEAYEEGLHAGWCTSMRTADDNPYPSDTVKNRAWSTGLAAARVPCDES